MLKFLLCVPEVAGSFQADPQQSEHLPSAHCWTSQNFYKGKEKKKREREQGTNRKLGDFKAH